MKMNLWHTMLLKFSLPIPFHRTLYGIFNASIQLLISEYLDLTIEGRILEGTSLCLYRPHLARLRKRVYSRDGLELLILI